VPARAAVRQRPHGGKRLVSSDDENDFKGPVTTRPAAGIHLSSSCSASDSDDVLDLSFSRQSSFASPSSFQASPIFIHTVHALSIDYSAAATTHLARIARALSLFHQAVKRCSTLPLAEATMLLNGRHSLRIKLLSRLLLPTLENPLEWRRN
jgi:hypothetical protein